MHSSVRCISHETCGGISFGVGEERSILARASFVALKVARVASFQVSV